MSRFIRLSSLIGAAALAFVIMLNAVPARAECNAGDQVTGDGRCMRNGQFTGQVICDAKCQARQRQVDKNFPACIEACEYQAGAKHPEPDADPGDDEPQADNYTVMHCKEKCGYGYGNYNFR
jgi:hypothetical protein